MINDLYAAITVFYCAIAMVLLAINAINDSEHDEMDPHYDLE